MFFLARLAMHFVDIAYLIVSPLNIYVLFSSTVTSLMNFATHILTIFTRWFFVLCVLVSFPL